MALKLTGHHRRRQRLLSFIGSALMAYAVVSAQSGLEDYLEAINASGQIGCSSLRASGNRFAFIWTPWRRMVGLGTLCGQESVAPSPCAILPMVFPARLNPAPRRTDRRGSAGSHTLTTRPGF